MTESLSTTENHREWLAKMEGQVVPEQQQAIAIEPFSHLKVESFVVSNQFSNETWNKLKQNIIPLAPSNALDPDSGKARFGLTIQQATLMDQKAFFALVQDQDLAPNTEGNWVMTILRPGDLELTPAEALAEMQSCFGFGSSIQTHGYAARAAYLALSGNNTTQIKK